jgi:hypothetical protein
VIGVVATAGDVAAEMAAVGDMDLAKAVPDTETLAMEILATATLPPAK